MECSLELVAVAFTRGVGGRVRLLLAVDRDGEPLLGGEPVLLAEHRPGSPHTQVQLEGADGIDPAAVKLVLELAAEQIAALTESAFDRAGEFHGERLLGRSLGVQAPHGTFR